MQLRAGEDLVVEIDTRGTIRVGTDSAPDWFGPGVVSGAGQPATPSEPTTGSDDMGHFTSVAVSRGSVECSLRAYPDTSMLVLSAVATVDLDGLGTGAFDQPAMAWPLFTPHDRIEGGAPSELSGLAFQHCEFALPTKSGGSLDSFFLLPHRPPTAWPLIAIADGLALMIAPLDNFHEQTVGVNGGSLRCGWHGDLDSVPAGFSTDLAIIAGTGPRDCLDRWGALVLARANTIRPGRWADTLASRPSYWTDNGAAYWYKTEPGHDVAGSIVAAVEDLRANDVPVGAVQLDSWFYPHEDLRPFDTDEWVVPPSALVAWESRDDVLPGGIPDLRHRLGDPALVAHIRHLSSKAPIAADSPTYVDGDYAAPATSEIYERWLDQCKSWGVETFEHDWLVEVFHGVRGMRERPGRARAWQEGIDAAARDRGITLQWCMGTPADFAQTSTLTQVTSIRTCGDHGYIATAGQLWAWFCTTNAMARSLGLMPFKDVFRADPEVAGDNGEPEALLSALSTGPVGLGDRVGRVDPALVMRTCRADGLLIKPDVPIAATDRAIVANPAFNSELLVAESYSDHAAGRWSYAIAMHAYPSDDPISGEIVLSELGESAPEGDVIVWDWRNSTAARANGDARMAVTLDREGWAYLVIAPVVDNGQLAVIGDVSKFVPAGDARIEVAESDGGVRLVVKGRGETVTITGWSSSAVVVTADGVGVTAPWNPDDGLWNAPLTVGERGWAEVVIVVNR